MSMKGQGDMGLLIWWIVFIGAAAVLSVYVVASILLALLF